MKLARFCVVRAAAAISLAVSAIPVSAGGPPSVGEAPQVAGDYLVDEIIVRFATDKPGIGLAAAEAGQRLAAVSAATGAALSFSHTAGAGATIARTASRMSLTEARRLARSISRQPGVLYAEPNERDFPQLVPNDTRYAADQWPLKAVVTSGSVNYGINAPAAWDITTGSASVRVAVLDTGIRPHADLAGKLLASYDMVTGTASANDGDARDSDPADPGDWVTSAESTTVGGPFEGCQVRNSSWHGTHVAGTIGAATDNNAGIAGVSWGSPIVPVRVLGKCGGTITDIADGIVWAAGGTVAGAPTNPNPAKVINMSLGGTGPCPATYRSAIATAQSLGAIVVVSAGNSRAGTGGARPANCPGVIAVTATAQDGERATYSNFGSPAIISAPGGDNTVDIMVLSTLNSGTQTPGADSFAFYQGTSMAAPHVAGTVALMLSVRPTLQSHHIAAFLRGTATSYPASPSAVDFDCATLRCGDGILNAATAVAAANLCTTPPTGTIAPVDATCNGDYDGNGIVGTMTDGIIATRLALGVTGTALTSGVLGACATRTTFDAIRRWSNAHCGTNY